MTVAIILGIVGFLVVCISTYVLLTRRRSSRRIQLRPARQPSPPIARPQLIDGVVVLRYGSGTAVALDEEGEQERRTAAGSVVSPMPRRRLPGLMPTAGHVVVPKARPSARSLVAPKAMDFSDDT